MPASFIHLRFNIALTLAVLTLLFSSSALATFFDQFRLIGNHQGLESGFVSSISFDKSQSTATVHFRNVAGINEELTVALSASQSIPAAVPVFLPPPAFIQPPPPSLDLSGVEFMQGAILTQATQNVPPHWFRLTYFDERWSGTFRIDRRIYTIDRASHDDTIVVRPARHGDLDFLPQKRIKLSAVIDEYYVNADAVGDGQGMDNLGHIFALESVHVMDGLLSDSLGITTALEQVIYQTADQLGNHTTANDLLNGAEQWSDTHADAFGLTDNLAILFFSGQLDTATGSAALATNDHIAVLGNTSDYQFATGHAFGQVLGLPAETTTLQQWPGDDTTVQDVLWSDTQNRYLSDHPLPAALVQTISYDAPEIANPPADEPAQPLDQQLINAELPESEGIIGNDDATSQTVSTGTGCIQASLLLLLLLSFRSRQKAPCTSLAMIT